MTLAALLSVASEALRLIPSPDAELRRARIVGRLRARAVRLRSQRQTRSRAAALARVEAMLEALEAA